MSDLKEKIIKEIKKVYDPEIISCVSHTSFKITNFTLPVIYSKD